MTEPFADRPRRVTLCVDKGSDAEDFANELRAMSVTPHMAQNTGGRRSAVGKRHRGGVRPDQDDRRSGEDPISRRRAGASCLYVRGCGLRPRASARASGSSAMTGPAECQVIGPWRIIEADLWDRDYLDLVEPAFISFGPDGHGEFAFGAVNAGMDLEYARTMVFFTFTGFDEMDQVSGSGSAALADDGTLEVELSFHLGDDATLKAVRD